MGKVKIEWSANFAYIVGIIASDGCLQKNNSIVSVTSKDIEVVENIKKTFKLSNKIGIKVSKFAHQGHCYVIQFGDVLFCRFLNSIGIYPNKSKTIGNIAVPAEFFFDFLRGHFDGDGCAYSYFDKRWKSSFMFYISIVSASPPFIDGIRLIIQGHLGIKGHLTRAKESTLVQLRYAKREAVILASKMYENNPELYLIRKRLKINGILSTIASTSQKRDG